MSKVQQGQSFIDMVYQQTGSFEEILKAAVLNGKSITDSVEIGESIKTENITHPENQQILMRKNPATNISQNQTEAPLEGIGYWIIEQNFKVS